MPKFQIWSEGYKATGEAQKACPQGSVEANSFQEACDELFLDNQSYDSERLTIWGCRLFDNEDAAREAFG